MSTPRRISKHTDGRGRFFDIPVSPEGRKGRSYASSASWTREHLIHLIHAAMQKTTL
jgi:hypothetical protein